LESRFLPQFVAGCAASIFFFRSSGNTSIGEQLMGPILFIVSMVPLVVGFFVWQQSPGNPINQILGAIFMVAGAALMGAAIITGEVVSASAAVAKELREMRRMLNQLYGGQEPTPVPPYEQPEE
jgi:peptidoglycan/LPS O-acetylase OafA/YrhL